MMKNKKGFAPIISIFLIVLFVVSLVAGVYVYVQENIESKHKETKMILCNYEKIKDNDTFINVTSVHNDGCIIIDRDEANNIQTNIDKKTWLICYNNKENDSYFVDIMNKPIDDFNETIFLIDKIKGTTHCNLAHEEKFEKVI